MSTRSTSLDICPFKSTELGEGKVLYQFDKKRHAKRFLRQLNLTQDTESSDPCKGTFQGILSSESMDQRRTKPCLKEVTGNVLQDILDYVYTATLTVGSDNVTDHLNAACRYPLPGIAKVCCEWLIQKLDAENVLGVFWLQADIMGSEYCEDLLSAARQALMETPKRKDGKPDMRFTVNRELLLEPGKNKDGTPDMRLRVNKNAVPGVNHPTGHGDHRSSSASSHTSVNKTAHSISQYHPSLGGGRSCVTTPRSTGPLKMDGTPDMRYAANR